MKSMLKHFAHNVETLLQMALLGAPVWILSLHTLLFISSEWWTKYINNIIAILSHCYQFQSFHMVSNPFLLVSHGHKQCCIGLLRMQHLWQDYQCQCFAINHIVIFHRFSFPANISKPFQHYKLPQGQIFKSIAVIRVWTSTTIINKWTNGILFILI